jgi:hypothetical protein
MTNPTLDPVRTVYHLGNLTEEKTKCPEELDIGNIDVVLVSLDQHVDNLDDTGRLLLHKIA